MFARVPSLRLVSGPDNGCCRLNASFANHHPRGLALTIGTESGRDWTVTLRRQHARTAEGQPTGCYTNTFEIICRDCGDDSSRDYNNVPPRLQRIRGPYEIDAGLTVYQAHIAWHEELAHAR